MNNHVIGSYLILLSKRNENKKLFRVNCKVKKLNYMIVIIMISKQVNSYCYLKNNNPRRKLFFNFKSEGNVKFNVWKI